MSSKRGLVHLLIDVNAIDRANCQAPETAGIIWGENLLVLLPQQLSYIGVRAQSCTSENLHIWIHTGSLHVLDAILDLMYSGYLHYSVVLSGWFISTCFWTRFSISLLKHLVVMTADMPEEVRGDCMNWHDFMALCNWRNCMKPYYAPLLLHDPTSRPHSAWRQAVWYNLCIGVSVYLSVCLSVYLSACTALHCPRLVCLMLFSGYDFLLLSVDQLLLTDCLPIAVCLLLSTCLPAWLSVPICVVRPAGFASAIFSPSGCVALTRSLRGVFAE